MPSDDLMARILGDAEAVQAATAVTAAQPPSVRPAGILAAFLAALGGWPAVAGLASAAMAGVWIGAASPDLVNGLVGLNDTSSEELTAYDLGDLGFGEYLLAEGL